MNPIPLLLRLANQTLPSGPAVIPNGVRTSAPPGA